MSKESQNAHPFENIALALSGGGFRAASFALGTMSYLQSLPWAAGNLLEKVSFISSTSGGSIANAHYILGLANGKPQQQIFEELYEHLKGKTLLDSAMERLTTASAWHDYPDKSKNLINAFAITYHEDLFDGQTVGSTLHLLNEIHVKEVAFNCAELNNGLSFRFQWRLKNPVPRDMGNHYLHFAPGEIAMMSSLRLGDILAASSCFPLGFEPIVFPEDFASSNASVDAMRAAVIMDHNQVLEDGRRPTSFALLDGGVVDNQGIYSLTLEDMSRQRGTKDKESSQNRPFSLMIVTDVASYFMDNYEPPARSNAVWRNIPIVAVLPIVAVIAMLPVLATIVFALQDLPWYNYLALVPGYLISAAIFTVFVLVEHSHTKDDAEAPAIMLEKYRLPLLLKPLGWWWDAVSARIRSFTTLASDMFLKQIRRMYQRDFYENPINKGRIVSNFIYALSSAKLRPSDPTTLRSNKEDEQCDVPVPSLKLREVAEEARNVSTTLWFGEDSTKDLDKVVATGQFTICYNLLEFLGKMKDRNDGELASDLEAVRLRLLRDFEKFNEKPQFMMETFKKSASKASHSEG